ncbi:lysophospholipid acyltransferase family protein [Priestia flexa]|uniref:lysophospholipid acyltransferase family protein n=1 Tax=Priestia flexa TaxID=86664 RepID=UPI00099BE141|nr:lysophospholipid acyltransferase family protein [Priestia flexa]
MFIDRVNRRASVQALKDSVCLLKEGHSMVIFPEGTRSKGKGIGEFKKGSIRIALDAKGPIVPVAIQGISNIMEQCKVGFQKADVTIRILPSVTTDLDAGSDPNVIHHQVRERIIQALNNHHQVQSKRGWDISNSANDKPERLRVSHF